MKILHTSDWHLGKYLNTFSRHAEQIEVMQEICTISEEQNVDAVLIAGDLFDNYNPSIESTELFYKTLKRLSANGKRAVIAIAGNHDSPDRIEAPDPLARECGIIFAGYPNSVVPVFELDSGLSITHSEEGFISLKLPNVSEPLRILLTPYANEHRLKTFLGYEDEEEELRMVLQRKWQELAEKHCDNKGVNILVAHLLMMKEGGTVPEEPDDEKPILHVGGAQVIYNENLPGQIQYTALGHLHRKQKAGKDESPVVYSGSPISYSFGEANQKKFVLIVNAESGKPVQLEEIELLKGKMLLRKRATDMDEAVEWLEENPEALVELTMATETFLTAEERKRLSNAHKGIVSLIPDVKNMGGFQGENKKNIDLSKNLDVLFAEYFKHVYDQEPNENIMSLFKEVLSEEAEK